MDMSMAWEDYETERRRRRLSDSQPVTQANKRALWWWVGAGAASAALWVLVWAIVGIVVKLWVWRLLPWQ